MIRIAKTELTYRGVDRSAARAAALSRAALALLARRAVPAGGHIERIQVEVRVTRDMADIAIAERIADTLARRL